MSYLRDAILESNQLEDDVRFQKAKNPPTLKGRRKREIKECGDAPAVEVTEGVVKDTIGAIGDTAEKVSKVCDVITEETEPLTEEAGYVNIEDVVPKEAYVESFGTKKIVESIELPNRPKKGKKGSPEYDANEGRRKRVATYRKIANLEESVDITEDNIMDWAFKRACMWEGVSPERLRAELLRQPFTGLERYEED